MFSAKKGQKRKLEKDMKSEVSAEESKEIKKETVVTTLDFSHLANSLTASPSDKDEPKKTPDELICERLKAEEKNTGPIILNLADHNFSSPTAAQFVANFIATHQVIQLNLSNSNFLHMGMDESLINMLATHPFIQRLNLKNTAVNSFLPLLTKLLSTNTTLLHLDLSSNHIEIDTPEATAAVKQQTQLWQPVGEMLAVNSTLLSLNLSDNAIDATGSEWIARGVMANKSSALESLDLSDNELPTLAAPIFAALLVAENCKLKNLLLNGHLFDDKGCQIIFSALAKNDNLETLHLDANTKHRAELSTAIAELASVLQRKRFNPLKLHLNGYTVPADNMKTLIEALALNRWLHGLKMPSTRISEENIALLRVILAQHNHTLTSFKCATQDGAVKKLIGKNNLNMQRNCFDWQRLTTLIASMRANEKSEIKDSILTLIGEVMKYSEGRKTFGK